MGVSTFWRSGEPLVWARRISSLVGDDCTLRQKVTVKPGARYRFSGAIKTSGAVGGSRVASLSLVGESDGSKSVSGTSNWEKVSFEFNSGTKTMVEVAVRLGQQGTLAIGFAWFDDLSLVEIDK